MSKKKYKNCCKGVADQYLTLVTIYAAIINQQFDNADELEVFADFLIALGEELSLAASVRGMCEEGVGEDGEESWRYQEHDQNSRCNFCS